MILYILTMTIDEDGTFNDYVRGVFTTLDKAKEGASFLMKTENAMDNYVEICISKCDTDKVEAPIGVIGWYKDNGEYSKYFDTTNKKTLADKIKDGDELSELEKKIVGIALE